MASPQATTIIINTNPTQKITQRCNNLPLLITNYLLLFIGTISSSLISKYYFIHKGSSRWVSTFVQSAGSPALLLVIFIPYFFRCTERKPFSGFTRKLLVFSIFMGFLSGLNNLLFSWGNSYLPVSTFSLLLSTQLVFNLILSVIIVKQKVTFTNLNCVILLTISSVLVALGSSHDKPENLSRGEYFLGFLFAAGAALLFALSLPLLEKIFNQVYCYAMVVEIQLIMGISATVLAAAGMAANGGFHDMVRESERVFDKGSKVYWATLTSNVITWQFCFLGSSGMIFLTSALNSAICMTALLAMNVVAGVLAFREDFGGVKMVSTVLCLWGFCSYVYGMYVKIKKEYECQETEMILSLKHEESSV